MVQADSCEFIYRCSVDPAVLYREENQIEWVNGCKQTQLKKLIELYINEGGSNCLPPFLEALEAIETPHLNFDWEHVTVTVRTD